MDSLPQLTEQIAARYSGHSTSCFRIETLKMMDSGYLRAGTVEYPIIRDGLKQFANRLKIPSDYFADIDPDIRALIFNRYFHKQKNEQDIALIFNEKNRVIGYDDPNLLRITPLELMKILQSALPSNLLTEEIAIGRLHMSDMDLSFSFYGPQIVIEPKPDDIINGGIDVSHSLIAGGATQIRCYLRRLVCRNGATAHICCDNHSLRSRRLANQNFQLADMVQQLQYLFQQAFQQLDQKLASLQLLLKNKMIDLKSLEQVRAKYSLNNNIISQIKDVIQNDSLGPTGTQYDLFNAISYVATHSPDLALRQQRTLMHMAGEFSQSHVRQCSQCGSWIKDKT